MPWVVPSKLHRTELIVVHNKLRHECCTPHHCALQELVSLFVQLDISAQQLRKQVHKTWARTKGMQARKEAALKVGHCEPCAACNSTSCRIAVSFARFALRQANSWSCQGAGHWAGLILQQPAVCDAPCWLQALAEVERVLDRLALRTCALGSIGEYCGPFNVSSDYMTWFRAGNKEAQAVQHDMRNRALELEAAIEVGKQEERGAGCEAPLHHCCSWQDLHA